MLVVVLVSESKALYLLNFEPTIDNFKNFQWTRNSSYRTLIDYSTENLFMNFGLIAVFVKVAFEITKRALRCVLPTCVKPVIECISVIYKTNE